MSKWLVLRDRTTEVLVTSKHAAEMGAFERAVEVTQNFDFIKICLCFKIFNSVEPVMESSVMLLMIFIK